MHDEQQSARVFDWREYGSVASTTTAPPAALAVERAVGSAEVECRQRGDCLETGQWDGAVGWNWGAKDRCVVAHEG